MIRTEEYEDMIRERFDDSTFAYRSKAFRKFLYSSPRNFRESPTTRDYVKIDEEDLIRMIGQKRVSAGYAEEPRYEPDIFIRDEEVPTLSGQIVFEPLSDAIEHYPDLMASRVFKEIGTKRMEQIINSGWTSGYFLLVDENSENRKISIETSLHANYSSASKSVIYLRKGASATVTDIYRSHLSGESIQGRNIYIFLEENSRLQYNYLQEKSVGVTDICYLRSFLDRNSNLRIFHVNSGGGRVIFHTEGELRGDHSSYEVNGVNFSAGDQKVDIGDNTFQTGKNTSSNVRVRGISRDHSTMLHRGSIDIEESGVMSSGFYDSKILLMSREAYANSKPSLIIRNSYTRSKHGSAISTIDRDELFYLRSRGIDETSSTSMIVDGFVSWLLEKSDSDILLNHIARLSSFSAKGEE